jgi:hypothetical protein
VYQRRSIDEIRSGGEIINRLETNLSVSIVENDQSRSDPSRVADRDTIVFKRDGQRQIEIADTTVEQKLLLLGGVIVGPVVKR